MINALLSISTQNNRGMHIYAKNLTKLLNKKLKSKLYLPTKIKYSKYNLDLLSQILFELKPIKINNIEEFNVFISVHPRYPIDMLINNKKFLKKGIVIHDYMQCINIKEILNNPSILKSLGIKEFLKRMYHTFLFKITLKKIEFIIFNSKYTKNGIGNWSKKQVINRKPSIVIHPLPSFDMELVVEEAKKFKSYKAKNELNLLFISGNQLSKRSTLILPIISLLAEENPDIYFKVSVIGLKNMSFRFYPNNLEIYAPKESISNKELVKKYLEADFFLSTSIEEGFGMPLLDALCFGVKSIVSDIPTYREIRDSYSSLNCLLIKDHHIAKSYVNQINSEINKYEFECNFLNKANNYALNYSEIFKKSEIRINNFLFAQIERN